MNYFTSYLLVQPLSNTLLPHYFSFITSLVKHLSRWNESTPSDRTAGSRGWNMSEPPAFSWITKKGTSPLFLSESIDDSPFFPHHPDLPPRWAFRLMNHNITFCSWIGRGAKRAHLYGYPSPSENRKSIEQYRKQDVLEF